jgi:hypothetical protein
MEESLSPVIRIALKSDVPAMAGLHMASFSPEEHLGTLLGPKFVEASYNWHVKDKKAYVIIAELEGKLLGLLGMCDGPFTVRMVKGSLAAFLGAFFLKPHLLVDRRLWARLKRERSNSRWADEFCSTFGVAQMTIGAVAEAARGYSVFPRLIKACEEIGRARGNIAIRAGVYRGNAACRRAFQKGGWTQIDALGSSETVYFVRVFDADLFRKFPRLKADEKEE